MVKRIDIPQWHKTAESLLETYYDIRTHEMDDIFKEHVDFLREHIDELDDSEYPANHYPSKLSQFMRFFGFNIEMKGFIRHFIKTSEIDFDLMKSRIAIIDNRDNTYKLNIDSVDEDEYWEDYPDQESLKIVIPNGTRISEIIEFVKAEKDYINKQLQNSTVPRKKMKESPPWIAIRIINLKRKGLSSDKIAEIARIENWPAQALNGDSVTAIYKRSKNLHKTPKE
jgi:hypothetical protein